MNENPVSDHRESLCHDFEEKFGIEVAQAEALLHEPSPFLDMAKHMYYDAMDQLRECEIADAGARIQGMAQLLWEFVNMQNAINEIRKLED